MAAGERYRDSNELRTSELITVNKSPRVSSYQHQIEKLQSIGPLNILDLNEFLKKSKIDFLNLYKDKTISNYKITDFTVIRKLGSGSFGKVVLGKSKEDETLYAIKVIDKRAVIKDFNFLYFVMPFVPGGDFYDYLQDHKPLTEVHAKFYICQLVLALEYLHYLELIHRDVKPENIMLDALGYIKLADFGQCVRCYRNDKAWTLTGTPEYMAPEIIKGIGYDYAVDWWALGVTLYEMCAGHRPFKHASTSKLYKLVLQVNYELPSTFSKQLASLVKQLMTGIPAKRIIGEEVKTHPWFKNTDWYGVLNRLIPAPYVPKTRSE